MTNLDHYIDRTRCEMLALNETVQTPAISTCLSLKHGSYYDGIVEDKLLHIESAKGREKCFNMEN
jgi:hypothetical protein